MKLSHMRHEHITYKLFYKLLVVAHLCNDMSICIDCVTGVMVAWTGIEHFKLGRIQNPPPIDEPEDVYVSWSKFLFTMEEQQSMLCNRNHT